MNAGEVLTPPYFPLTLKTNNMTTVLIILAIINLIALTIVFKNQKHILDKIEKLKNK